MKRSTISLTIVLGLLFSSVAVTLAANVVSANPVVPADIEVYSPQNKVYYSNEVELGFIAPSRYVYPRLNFTSFSYSLDGQANVTISGNTTVTGLQWGSHSLVVYGEDADRNSGSSRTVNFSVFFATVWIIWILVAAIVLGSVCITLLLCRRKRHKEAAQK